MPMRVKADPEDELFKDLDEELGITMALETDAYIDLTAASPEKEDHNPPISVVDAALNRLGTDDISQDRCPNL